MTLGLEQAGFEVVCGVDNWPTALVTYRRNFHHMALRLDLGAVEASYEALCGMQPDMVVGGPPCQDFSSAGRRDEEGGRGILTVRYAELVCRLRPQWVLMENVSNVLKYSHVHEALETLRHGGYGLSYTVLNAALCGVPQRRKRFILVGRMGSGDGFFDAALRQGLAERELTVREYFDNVLCRPLGIEAYYRHPRSYARRGVFSVDEPSPTIRGVNRPVAPNYPLRPNDPVTSLEGVRPLTTAVRAAIQTFPEAFEFVGSRCEVEQMIGNAVPCNLARHVGRLVLAAMATDAAQ